MALTRVQTAVSANQADPGSATFTVGPTEGNLLVALVSNRSGQSLGVGTATISGSGWTQIIGRDTELADADHRRAIAAFWKVAGASEPSTIEIDNGQTDTKAVILAEYNDDAAGTWDFAEKADNDNGVTNGATSIGTGTTASTSGNQLIVTLFSRRNNATTPDATVTFTTAGNVFSTALGSFASQLASGFSTSSSAGTKTDTASTDSDNSGLSAAIMVFTATAGGGGGATHPGWVGLGWW